MLVFLTGFGKPSLVIVPVEMLDKLHLSIDREPVGMNIQGTHEDTDHEALVVEIDMLVSIFHYHNLTIGRCHHQLLCVAIEITDRTAVEV